MNWKKILAWASFMCIGFLGGIIIGLSIFKSAPSLSQETEKEVLAMAVPTPSPSPLLTTPQPTDNTENQTQYLLTLSGSSVCLYELVPGGTTVLLQETGIDLAQLRKEDYENLCRGYTVDSLEEAKILCEDFGS